MHFINSSQRVMFRTPTEAWFYDMDGSLTDTGVKEDYTLGPTGLKWKRTEFTTAIGNSRELENSALAQKLESQLEFTQQEWDEFGIEKLQVYHFVKSSDGSYFIPADGRRIGYATFQY